MGGPEVGDTLLLFHLKVKRFLHGHLSWGGSGFSVPNCNVNVRWGIRSNFF